VLTLALDRLARHYSKRAVLRTPARAAGRRTARGRRWNGS
jgi:hypothetical protein